MEANLQSRGVCCDQLNVKVKHLEGALGLCSNLPADSERCESKELDIGIRHLIARNQVHRPEELNPFASDPGDLKKNMTATVEEQLRWLEEQRKELLEVNKQWDHQYRNMKLRCERKITEMKVKLQAAENNLRKLSKESKRLQDLVQEREMERHLDHAKEREWEEQQDLEAEQRGRELQQMRKQNWLLQEENASSIRSNQCYQQEISRLNKVLSESLKGQTPSSQEQLDPQSCSPEEMRTQIEVLQQQVQIYEEDFKKERADRERLSAEKEGLQKANDRLRWQLSGLSCQILPSSRREVRHQLPPHLHLSPCANCAFAARYLEPSTEAATRGVWRPQQHQPADPPDVHQKANGRAVKKEISLKKPRPGSERHAD